MANPGPPGKMAVKMETDYQDTWSPNQQCQSSSGNELLKNNNFLMFCNVSIHPVNLVLSVQYAYYSAAIITPSLSLFPTFGTHYHLTSV